MKFDLILILICVSNLNWISFAPTKCIGIMSNHSVLT